MKTQKSFDWVLILGVMVLGALGTNEANAQYGGVPSGTIFGPPRDAQAPSRSQRSPDLPGPAMNQDHYDPNVWLAQKGARWNRRNSPTTQQVSYEEGMMAEPVSMGEPGMEYEVGPEMPGFGPEMGGCESCGNCDGGGCDQCCETADWCCFPCPKPEFLNLTAGVQGFKGPPTGIEGNFGFNEGINLAGPVRLFQCYDLGYQVGVRAVQSNLSGQDVDSEVRNQTFFTAGLFHQADVGLQYGVVWDYLRDNAEVFDGQFETSQVRGQVSLINYRGAELGSWVAVNVRSNNENDTRFENDLWETTNQYAFFYRRYLDCGGWYRVWGGFTGTSDGIFGGDAVLPLSDCFALSTNFNYLIPSENQTEGARNEGWNLGINLVWYLKSGSRSVTQHNINRPMFDIADNGTMFLERMR